MRLVPNQEWEHITELFTKHFMSIDSVVTWKWPRITEVRLCNPIDSIGYKAANMAYTETLSSAIPVRSGGSIPL
jgi:hypothetical protein